MPAGQVRATAAVFDPGAAGLLILLLLGPGLVFTGMLLLRYATVERDRYSLEALTTARQIAAVIDRDLNGLGHHARHPRHLHPAAQDRRL